MALNILHLLIFLKIQLDNYNIKLSYSSDRKLWKSYPNAYDVSGYQANIIENFSSLRVGVIFTGEGKNLY